MFSTATIQQYREWQDLLFAWGDSVIMKVLAASRAKVFMRRNALARAVHHKRSLKQVWQARQAKASRERRISGILHFRHLDWRLVVLNTHLPPLWRLQGLERGVEVVIERSL